MRNPQFVRVRTSGEQQVQPVVEEFALRELQLQYGRETGLKFFVDLARGQAKCASIRGPYMIEIRGDPLT